jgi:hypothetical protein
MIAPAAVANVASSVDRAMPKSVMIAFSDSSIRMFAGLRSRWTTPTSCAARRPDTI